MSSDMSGYDRCKVCGQIFECDCELIPAADVRKLVEKWRKEHKDEHYYHAGLFADELEQLLER